MPFSILNLLIVLAVAWLAGRVAARFGYPSVLGELVAGILIGPPLLGLVEGSDALAVIAEVGVLLMMLYIGMEIDPKELKRASTGGFLAAIGGFITPFVLCYLVVVYAGGTAMAGIFVGVAAGVTSLATKSRILVDLKLLDTRIAHVMMAGALIADTLSLIIFAVILGVADVGAFEPMALLGVAAKVTAFFVIAYVAGRSILPAVGRWIRKDEFVGGATGRFTIIVLIGLAYAEMAELAGMHGILGAFVAGLFLQPTALGRTAAKEVMHLVRDASLGFFAPVFFVTAGFAVSLDVFRTDLVLLASIVGLATVGKIIGTAVFYLPTGHGWREGVTLGAGMNGRGAVEIIVAQIGLSAGLITQEIFSILVFMAIATTATVPLFLKWGVSWLRNRGELVRSDNEREGTLIVGAGPTARALASMLAKSQSVRLLDENAGRCAEARAAGLEAHQGNALDEDVLSEVGAAQVRHFVALTDNAEVNALSANLARTVFLTPLVHVVQTGSKEGTQSVHGHIGSSTLFGGTISLADWDFRLDHDLAEPLAHDVTAAEVNDERVKDSIRDRGSWLSAAVMRGEQHVVFHDGLTLEEGDKILGFRLKEVSDPAFDRFDRLVSKCTILDLEHKLDSEEFFGEVASVMAPDLGMEKADLAARFQDREAASSTVVLPGLAVPHVIIEGSKRFALTIVRARRGIRFPDQGMPVHAAFVLAGTKDEKNFHLQSLAAIAKIAQWPNFERNWLQASGTDALRQLVLRSARRRVVDRAASTGVLAAEGS